MDGLVWPRRWLACIAAAAAVVLRKCGKIPIAPHNNRLHSKVLSVGKQYLVLATHRKTPYYKITLSPTATAVSSMNLCGKMCVCAVQHHRIDNDGALVIKRLTALL